MLLMNCYRLRYLVQLKLIQFLVQWEIKSLCLGHERQEKPHTILVILQFSSLLILRGWWIIAACEEIEEYWYLQFRGRCLFKQNCQDNQITQQQTLQFSVLNFIEGFSFKLQLGSLTSFSLIHYFCLYFSIYPFPWESLFSFLHLTKIPLQTPWRKLEIWDCWIPIFSLNKCFNTIRAFFIWHC